MAPEQWEGKPADTRSDIYAFGCVLYGMLTGKRVGQGPLAGLEAHPPALQSVVRTCLEKDSEERWQTVHDVKCALELTIGLATKEKRDWGWLAAASVLLGALAVWAVLHITQPQTPERVLRLDITPPEGSQFLFGVANGGMALSPDGRTEAYVAMANGRARSGSDRSTARRRGRSPAPISLTILSGLRITNPSASLGRGNSGVSKGAGAKRVTGFCPTNKKSGSARAEPSTNRELPTRGIPGVH
jgi:hypothetical protein